MSRAAENRCYCRPPPRSSAIPARAAVGRRRREAKLSCERVSPLGLTVALPAARLRGRRLEPRAGWWSGSRTARPAAALGGGRLLRGVVVVCLLEFGEQSLEVGERAGELGAVWFG